MTPPLWRRKQALLPPSLCFQYTQKQCLFLYCHGTAPTPRRCSSPLPFSLGATVQCLQQSQICQSFRVCASPHCIKIIPARQKLHYCASLHPWQDLVSFRTALSSLPFPKHLLGFKEPSFYHGALPDIWALNDPLFSLFGSFVRRIISGGLMCLTLPLGTQELCLVPEVKSFGWEPSSRVRVFLWPASADVFCVSFASALWPGRARAFSYVTVVVLVLLTSVGSDHQSCSRQGLLVPLLPCPGMAHL